MRVQYNSSSAYHNRLKLPLHQITTNGPTMNDDHAKTLVMDIAPGTAGNKPSAAEVADKIQASIDERNDTSSDATFTQTYSYLT